MPNKAKYMSYKYAFSQAAKSIENRYYLEAICIYESVISDRMVSFIRGAAPSQNPSLKTPFVRLISMLRYSIKQDKCYFPIEADKISLELGAWIVKRNTCVHSIAKSIPGTGTMPLSEFHSISENVALTGKTLANRMSRWQRKELNAARKASKIL